MKYYSFILLLLFSTTGFSQRSDSTFSRQKIKSSQIDVLLSYYNQDGNNSAVTGGTGTEKLTVYMNKIVFNQIIDSLNAFSIEGGVDVISSASTDNIDFNVSSASSQDNRLWIAGSYQRTTKKRQDLILIYPSFSIESDYMSVGLGAGYVTKNKLGNWTFGANFQAFADDLRWGRLNEDYRRPETLIYPIELRDSAWFDIYMRYSYNLNFDIQHDINRRMRIGFFPGIIIQKGLLSTPFHRFFFAGNARAVVENLPRSRVKIPLGIQLNSFVGARTVVQLYYRFYWDDFDIISHTVNLETPIKIVPQFSITPFIRYYWQSQATYFFPYLRADVDESFFTSDYDLSGFNSFKVGLGAQFLTLRRSFFKQISVRYAHYSRSDGLTSNQISTYFSMATK
jgi:hypothetical protein